ncbi:hypothetical protein BCR34DRAFT_70713 [Clohesyomyces aquaticus]|uniref:Uncharacterized protein n=1 Tax=Clohesyomyces aquaticus TaxID=1231657 RepID=A0A1Y1YZD8_9PLEO|nr:hypothetical protein BCR34DRAFT_70713 [Clohesyomyces aquaticus]
MGLAFGLHRCLYLGWWTETIVRRRGACYNGAKRSRRRRGEQCDDKTPSEEESIFTYLARSSTDDCSPGRGLKCLDADNADGVHGEAEVGKEGSRVSTTTTYGYHYTRYFLLPTSLYFTFCFLLCCSLQNSSACRSRGRCLHKPQKRHKRLQIQSSASRSRHFKPDKPSSTEMQTNPTPRSSSPKLDAYVLHRTSHKPGRCLQLVLLSVYPLFQPHAPRPKPLASNARI